MSLIPLIETGLKERNNKPATEYGVWFASDSGKCHRRRILRRKGIKGKDLSVSTLRTLNMGSLIHEFIERTLKRNRAVLATELSLRWRNVSGRADVIYLNESGDTPQVEVADVKTVHPLALSKPRDDKEMFEQMQIGVYGLALTLPQKWDDNPLVHEALRTRDALKLKITTGRVLYVSREDLRMKEFTFPLYDGLYSMIEKDYELLDKELEAYEKDGTLPAVLELEENGKEKWQCQYCDYRMDYCRDELLDLRKSFREVGPSPTTRKIEFWDE